MASSSIDAKIKLWDTRMCKSILNLNSHSSLVKSLQFSPNSKFIISGDVKGSVKLYDIVAGKQMQESEGEKAIRKIIFNPTFQKYTLLNDDQIIKSYDFSTGEIVKLESYTDVDPNIRDQIILPGGEQICSLLSDNSYKIYNIDVDNNLGPKMMDLCYRINGMNTYGHSLDMKSQSGDKFKFNCLN